jgi:putative transcriptional regulator
MNHVIVNHVSRLLGERRLSVKDLERGTGVSYSTLYNWYAGRVTRFDADVLDKLCQFFDVTVADILEHRPGEPRITDDRETGERST